MALPMAQNLSNEAALGPDFVEAISLKPLDGFIPIYTIRSYMELSKPVVVEHHCHFTFNFDFQVQV